jgi:hypothetical protein
MKTFAPILLFLASPLRGLDPDEIRKIAAEPHDRAQIMEELRVFPDARKYKVVVQTGVPGSDLQQLPPSETTQKVVRGRYIVSEFPLFGFDDPMIVVITYDKTSDTFKKWMLDPNGNFGSMSGVANLNQRVIAWVTDNPPGNPSSVSLLLESYNDSEIAWKETLFHGGKVVSLSRGSAVKTE